MAEPPKDTPSATTSPAAGSSAIAQIPRSSKPVSEALLNEKVRSFSHICPRASSLGALLITPSLCEQWDRAISSMLIRSTLGLSFGVVFSVLLFKRRAWPAWVGLGFGAGRAWEEADSMFFLLILGLCDGWRGGPNDKAVACLDTGNC